ncbi:hypothetical protein HMPREF0863_01639 [Erysipelotrichaceae bacterium 5_2_54FAA]|nr:hypothetical protein HMPREF0863_01639 [Erysipelotrichaceae bacterium 5_2_54FAA]
MKITNVKVKINRDAIAQLNKAKERALELTAEAMLSDIVSREVVPKDTGELERSGFVEDGHIDAKLIASIVFDTPYARRWYFNLDEATFQHTKNADARDHWMDYYLDGEGKQWVQDTYAKFLKQESGGLIE